MKKISKPVKPSKKVAPKKPESRANNLNGTDFAAYANFFETNALEELIIEEKGTKIIFRKNVAQQPIPAATYSAVPTAAPVATPAVPTAPPTVIAAPAPDDNDAGLSKINSPLNGTFYASPSPDSSNFISVGSIVSPGTVLCIVEAMKIFNEIKSELSGKIVRILVKPGEAVKDGQPLFLIEPA